MIQFNLLPDIKLEYIKAQKMRRLITSVSVIVTVAAVAILIILLGVDFFQKAKISTEKNNINTETSTLEGEPDITKILTVQNQLQSLTALHSTKPAASRLFNSYLDEVTPANISINDFQIDFNAHTATITGASNSLTTINQYVDTLKFTKYKIANGPASTDAFSNVVLAAFQVVKDPSDPTEAATYTITLTYDPTIFTITDNVSLSVPSITTTRSELEQPGDLFKIAPTSKATTSNTLNGTGGQ